MRKLLIALPFLLVSAHLARAACGDTTFTLTATYNPTTLNNHIVACDDSTMVIKLKAAAGVDTVRLQDTIKVRARPSGTVTRLVGEGAGGGHLVLTEFDPARPTLVHVFNPDRATLSGFSFVRKALNNDRHTVEIRAKGSVVTDCHFLMLDNSSVNQTGSLVSIAADSVLVERSLFRAPINGSGRSIAISGGTSGTSAPRNEYRSNVFHSTGIYLINGSFHVYANTFTGSRDPQHPIVVSGSMTDPANNLNIEHNLFAVKDDKTSPIMFAISNFSTVRGVIKNAWSRASASQHFMVNIGGGKVSGTDTAGANNNVVLPRGFSRYSPSAGEFKEYPIIQLRTDSNLTATSPSAWRIPRVFANNVSNWTNIPDISSGLSGSKLWFPGFAPLVAGRSWATEGQHIKVGALVDLDSRIPVTPLDSATLQNSSLRISRAPGDSTRMKVTHMFFNRDYYKAQFNPSLLYFFFSTSSASLASNDTTALKTAVGSGNWIRRAFSGFDSTDTVPKGVRTGNNIFVKMLHFNADGQAPVLSNGVIATLQAIPRFPSNDLSDPILAGGTDSAAGIFNVSVTKLGDEDIDSIRVTVIQPGGGTVTSLSKVAPNRNQTALFNFVLPRGQFAFNALPVARVGAAFQAGPQTASTRFYNSRQNQAESVFLANRASCEGADGSEQNPFCHIDSAMKALGPGGGTIVVKNMAGTAPFGPTVLGGADSGPVVLTAPMASGQFDPSNRVVFRGTAANEAFLLTRKNVTLRGLIFEMPAGASAAALSVKAEGVTVDGCLFRPAANSAAAVAAHLEPGAAQAHRFINNVIWGYTLGARVQSPSDAILILHNTFIKEPSVNSTAVVGLSAPGPVAATIANNWFSGVDTPYESFAGKSAKLFHNAYAAPAGDPLQGGLTESGTIDSVARLGQLDLTQSSFSSQLADGVDAVMICDAFKACNGLYAGATTAIQGGSVATDFLGKARGGVPDIGALDAKAEASTVRGVLITEVRSIPAAAGGHEKLAFTVQRKTLDPQDVDSIYVWWADGASVLFDASKPYRKYPLSRLDGGTFTDTLTGLASMKTYFVYAALGKVVGGERKLGYGYRASGTTDFKRDTSDCRFTGSSTQCPPAGGVFSVPDGQAKDQYFTKVSFALSDSGTVKLPKVEFASSDITRGRVSVFRPFPLITLSLESASLRAKGTRQVWKAEISMKANPIEILKGQSLYIISDSSAAPTYVPTWSIRPEANGAEAVLTIEGHSAGTFTYAFGNQAGAAAAEIEPADPLPPVFNFEDKAMTSVPFKFRGTGFSTSNPLVVVTPIPSAGRFAEAYKRVLFGEHKNKSLVLSAGLAGMDDSLRADHLHRYYRRAVAVDSATPSAAGRVKPFELADATFDEFRNNLLLSTPDLAVSAAGAAEEVSLTLPIDREYRIPRYYSPSSGHASNSIEVLFTVFDGDKVTRSSGYIRTRFTNEEMTTPEKSQRDPNSWHLFSFPWDEADAEDLKHVLAIETDKPWEPAKHRLMRYKGSGTGKDAFEVYDGTNTANFRYDSGMAVWSGAADFYTPQPRAGLSLDYKPFTLNFTAGQWNDFGLPFNFPIKWTDILGANPSWPSAQRVWRYLPAKKAGEKGTWAPLTPGNAEAGEAQSVVYPWQGLTVNPVASLFTGAPSLTIPLLDSSRSSAPMVPAAKTAAGSTYWSAKVTAYNGTAAMGVWIGMLDREDAFGMAPDVPGQDFRIAIREPGPSGDRLLSGLRRASGGDWQGHWALQGSASGEGVRVKVEENPKGIPLYLVETLSGRVTALAPETEAALSPEDLKTGDYHLVAGDSRYLQSVLDGLVPLHMLDLANYPNPFSGTTLIRYALPESWGKAEFRLRIRDARGRLVWDRDFRGSNTLRYLWDGRDRGGKAVGAGFYTLTLEAVTPGKAPRKAVRRMLKM